jgi:hypothetical protein
MLSLGCDATTRSSTYQCRQVCYTNEQQEIQIHSLMMLARFGAAGLLTDQQSHAVSAVTPQRAIINIAVQAVQLHK